MRKLIVPKFVDQYPTYSAGGFIATNEEPMLFNRLLGDLKVKRAAGITSGGEVLLSVLLPRAEEIISIDHSYRAISACIMKLLLVQKLSQKAVNSLLFDEKYEELVKHVNELWSQLPKPLAGASPDYITGKYNLREIRKGWLQMQLPPRTIQSLDKVTFIHGDLVKDLEGQFDLLYVSNAMEHQNRDHKYLTLTQLQERVVPGGYLLFTSNGYYAGYKQADEEKYFERVGCIYGVRATWNHIVLRKK